MKIDIYDGLALSLTKKSRSPNPIPAECHAPINRDVIAILLHAILEIGYAKYGVIMYDQSPNQST